MSQIRESMDSREGFDEQSSDEYEAWLDTVDACDEDDFLAYDDDDDDYDGQPSEYDEWQDLYGGDDWDQGQYDYDDC